ncbi:MAG: hypothetical protein COV76_03035 [Candidatus Omnitrophica bacterium CG11_big_fil_rev_8_21_14_0_20_64_10]|nr:MAG: hypothetical protein COV76_03035 [Candidatus Omnitrophica bacterium CG11_big_fil_rev_8_21_14_0_20_64_10]
MPQSKITGKRIKELGGIVRGFESKAKPGDWDAHAKHGRKLIVHVNPEALRLYADFCIWQNISGKNLGDTTRYVGWYLQHLHPK